MMDIWTRLATNSIFIKDAPGTATTYLTGSGTGQYIISAWVNNINASARTVTLGVYDGTSVTYQPINGYSLGTKVNAKFELEFFLP